MVYKRHHKPVKTEKARQKRNEQRKRQTAKKKELRDAADTEAGITREEYVVPPPKPAGAKKARRGKRAAAKQEKVHLPDLDQLQSAASRA